MSHEEIREALVYCPIGSRYGIDVFPDEVRALLADRDRLAAEVERLTGILTDHNADCIKQCEARKAAGRHYCPMQNYNRHCPDCPRDGMVDAQIAAAGKDWRG